MVVVDESLAAADFERVAECARDIRAEILRASIPLRANLEALLRSAVLGAERARALSLAAPWGYAHGQGWLGMPRRIGSGRFTAPMRAWADRL